MMWTRSANNTVAQNEAPITAVVVLIQSPSGLCNRRICAAIRGLFGERPKSLMSIIMHENVGEI